MAKTITRNRGDEDAQEQDRGSVDRRASKNGKRRSRALIRLAGNLEGHRLGAAVAACGVASVLGVGAGAADPAKGQVVPLICDNGQTYTGVVNGDAEFTAIHDLDSTATIVPVALGPFTGTVTNLTGEVVHSFTNRGSFKGRSVHGLSNPVVCSFTFTDVNDGSQPEFPVGYVFTGSGTIVVRITPSH